MISLGLAGSRCQWRPAARRAAPYQTAAPRVTVAGGGPRLSGVCRRDMRPVSGRLGAAWAPGRAGGRVTSLRVPQWLSVPDRQHLSGDPDDGGPGRYVHALSSCSRLGCPMIVKPTSSHGKWSPAQPSSSGRRDYLQLEIGLPLMIPRPCPTPRIVAVSGETRGPDSHVALGLGLTEPGPPWLRSGWAALIFGK